MKPADCGAEVGPRVGAKVGFPCRRVDAGTIPPVW
jgi:hypothetical protein